ncbi:MAG TPA: TIR domain-containing protein [Pyrinomonadaceae bacterium]|nr:TIR domain-containing protein [Pyrinomonadaceae bacterium]
MLVYLLIVVALLLGAFVLYLYLRPRLLSGTRNDLRVYEGTLQASGGKKAASKPRYMDENVMFTVYRPKAVAPGRWYKFLAFAHLSERRPDAPPDAPDPVRAVELEAKQLLGKQFAGHLSTTQQTAHTVPHMGELVFAPHVEGVTFNPPAQGVLWLRDAHRAEFEMSASPNYEGQVLRGSLTIFLGRLILADIPITVRVDSTLPAPTPEHFEQSSARAYRKIFPSYSRLDADVVEEFERYAEAMGDKYLRDVSTLRSGEEWDERLRELIEQAEVFQLFWSSNSMRSQFVRREWEHALSLRRPNFVRPTFWEEPMPRDGELPPEDLARLHFHRIQRAVPAKPQPQSMPAAPAPASAALAPAPGASGLPKIVPMLLISVFFLGLMGAYLQSSISGSRDSMMSAPQASPPAAGEYELSQGAAMDRSIGYELMSRLELMVEEEFPDPNETRIVYPDDPLGLDVIGPGVIGIAVRDRIVSLHGTVRDEEIRRRAGDIAERLPYVRGVENLLDVQKKVEKNIRSKRPRANR